MNIMATKPSSVDYVWSREAYDLLMDTSICEKLVSPPYLKEWTVRELCRTPNKWNLILAKYPSFPRTRPAAAVVSPSNVKIAANSPSPSKVNTVNNVIDIDSDNAVHNSNTVDVINDKSTSNTDIALILIF